MEGEAVDAEQITAISKLPSREVLYGQLVGLVASPITGLARSLNQLVGGLAVALGGVLEKKESGEIPSGAAPAAAATEAEAPAAPAEDTNNDQDAEAPDAGKTPSTEDPAEGPDTTEETQEG
jgi:large subunit ribosomal protein L10